MVALLKMSSASARQSQTVYPRLRLADDSDRRMFARTEAKGRAEGRRLDHSVEARQQPRVTLDMRDVSVGGLSALSDAPLLAGELLALTVPGQSPLARPWHALGRVVRCTLSGTGGYRVAVEFDSLPAA